MDQFDNTIPEAEDPAAEFLAREENFLANLTDDDIQENNNNHHDDDIDVSNENVDMINSNEDHYDIDHDIDNIVQVKEESEIIRKWREQQKEILQKKDEQEEIKKHELQQQAKTELEDWYKQHKESISKIKSSNRNADKEFNTVEIIDKIDEPGMQWERIAKLCDFNTKINKSKDVSRMRSIILQLKQN